MLAKFKKKRALLTEVIYALKGFNIVTDGWITCNFTSFSKVFQSYQDNERWIMKTVCDGTPFMVEKKSPCAGLEFQTARPAGQGLTH